MNGVGKYNPLGKVPVLVTDGGECWYDSPIIAQYLDQPGAAPAMVPADPKAALKNASAGGAGRRQWEAAQALVREKSRPAAQQSESESLRQREKVTWDSMRWKPMSPMAVCVSTRSIWPRFQRRARLPISTFGARLVRDAASAD